MKRRWAISGTCAGLWPTTTCTPHRTWCRCWPSVASCLSREQVYRLVTQSPQRLSMDTLAALCDILGCTPNDLIEVRVVNAQVRKSAGVQWNSGAAGTEDHDPATVTTPAARRRAALNSEATAIVAQLITDLDVQTADAAVGEAARTSDALRVMIEHLTAHPDALRSGRSDGPNSVIKLAHALHGRGIAEVVLPEIRGLRTGRP